MLPMGFFSPPKGLLITVSAQTLNPNLASLWLENCHNAKQHALSTLALEMILSSSMALT